MAKKKRFKDVNTLYYSPKKGECTVAMIGKKATSKWRYADFPCDGISATVKGTVITQDTDTQIYFDKGTVCEFNPKWKKISCPPLQEG